ncbi:MAG: hypothetical protein AAGH90_09135 [Pseudomonadota bacterium]
MQNTKSQKANSNTPNNRTIGYRIIAIGVAGLILTSLPHIQFLELALPQQIATVSSSIGGTLLGATMAYFVFERLILEQTQKRITESVIRGKIESNSVRDDDAREMASMLLRQRFSDDALADMVSRTVVNWSKTYLQPYFDLSVDLKARISDRNYYDYSIQRSYRVKRSAIGNDFVIRCLRSDNLYNRPLLRSEQVDYTWAFAAHNETATLKMARFEVQEIKVNQIRLGIGHIEHISSERNKLVQYRAATAPALKDIAPDDLVEVVIRFTVRQARRFGFFGISAYQPTRNFKARFDFSDIDASEVFVMEYFDDFETVAVERPQEKVVQIEATEWVLPGNAAIFSWSATKNKK